MLLLTKVLFSAQNCIMEALIISGAFILALAGLLGAVVPGIPGPPLSFLALVVFSYSEHITYSNNYFFIMALIALGITLIDYYLPIYGTKRFGGTKAGIRGATVGLIAGVLVLPLLGVIIGPFGLIGIIAGPFVGAYLGESMTGASSELAMKSAIGSFLGFVAGTLMKLAYSFVVLGYLVYGVIGIIF